MVNKEQVAEVLQIVLDGLTAGESTEKKIEETKKFYETELAKVNEENQFYQRIIRVNLLGDYFNFKEAITTRFETPDGARLFQHQWQANDYNIHHHNLGSELEPKAVRSLSGFELEEFNKFVEDYVAAARKDTTIGIKDKEIK